MLTRFWYFKPEILSAFRSLVVYTVAKLYSELLINLEKRLQGFCGQVVVVDEHIMSHAQLGDVNLLILPDTTDGLLEVEADHSILVLGKELLHSFDGYLH